MIGFTIAGTAFAFLRGQSNSFIPILIGIFAIILALQFPLQKRPEVRNFNQYRDDYETIIQNWNEGLSSFQTPENYSRHCNLILLKIESREYCILVEDNGVVFFLDDPSLVIIYHKTRLSMVYPCDEVLSYLDDNWILCRPPLR